ncbi:hypothetical protein HN51_029047 [Arachis hypogaea]
MLSIAVVAIGGNNFDDSDGKSATFMALETLITNGRLKEEVEQNNPFSGDLFHLQRRQPQ